MAFTLSNLIGIRDHILAANKAAKRKRLLVETVQAAMERAVDPPMLLPDGRLVSVGRLWGDSDTGNAHGRAVTLDA